MFFLGKFLSFFFETVVWHLFDDFSTVLFILFFLRCYAFWCMLACFSVFMRSTFGVPFGILFFVDFFGFWSMFFLGYVCFICVVLFCVSV